MLPVESSDADRAKSRVLGGYLRVVAEVCAMRVRLATRFSGETVVPVEGEVDRAKAAGARIRVAGAAVTSSRPI